MGACLCCFGPGASSLDLALMLANELLSIIHANDARLLHRPPPSPTTPPPFVRLSSTLHLFPPFFVSSLYILFHISWITRIGFFFSSPSVQVRSSLDSGYITSYLSVRLSSSLFSLSSPPSPSKAYLPSCLTTSHTIPFQNFPSSLMYSLYLFFPSRR